MGNTNTNVTSGVKDQANSGSKKLYSLINSTGGGELVELMKKANRTKNFKEIDEAIRDKVKPFLYNEGKGKYVAIHEIVWERCKDRMGNTLKTKYMSICSSFEYDDNMTDADGNAIKIDPVKYKDVCWRLDERGAVGETILHLCLLNSTSVHADLAKRLLKIFPKLIVDIYHSEEYYGENVLHMAIVNEEPAMVKFLLERGADYNQRCLGAFMTPYDQKTRRKDSFEHEWMEVPLESNYDGYTYWGEYPLGFAACLGQEECVRLLVAKGADPNAQDTNGNTVLHMLVVRDKKDMFDLIVELGGRLDVKNMMGLTPLTLAAKLARKEMFDHILEIEREVFWIYGNVTCAAYPLENIDTISSTGDINISSAMFHIVYGDHMGHLDMMDGVISQLLKEKWKTFARYRFVRRFILFLVYFIIFVVAFMLRPGADIYPTTKLVNKTVNGSVVQENVTYKNPCYLLRIDEQDRLSSIARLTLEPMVVIGALMYIFLAIKEYYHQGSFIFLKTLKSSPAKLMFMMSCTFVILMVPGRAMCQPQYEDIMGVLAILTTSPYFLFFCRGTKIVGPFVVMIYKMIQGDLLRFFTIYVVFLIGFSQAMYVIFRGIKDSVFCSPVESLVGMFIMSLGEFADIYESFEDTRHPTPAKLVFVLYMVLVTLLLVNMLIAMMGNTYQMVNETQKEWLRQWAKIILVIEQTVTTHERKRQQIEYSQPMNDMRRALVIRWHQSPEEQEDLKLAREAEKIRQQTLLEKKQQQREQKAKQGSAINVTEAQIGHVNV